MSECALVTISNVTLEFPRNWMSSKPYGCKPNDCAITEVVTFGRQPEVNGSPAMHRERKSRMFELATIAATFRRRNPMSLRLISIRRQPRPLHCKRFAIDFSRWALLLQMTEHETPHRARDAMLRVRQPLRAFCIGRRVGVRIEPSVCFSNARLKET